MADGRLIETRGTERGYCDQCRQPSLVAVLELRGWDHKFRICPSCVVGFFHREGIQTFAVQIGHDVGYERKVG